MILETFWIFFVWFSNLFDDRSISLETIGNRKCFDLWILGLRIIMFCHLQDLQDSLCTVSVFCMCMYVCCFHFFQCCYWYCNLLKGEMFVFPFFLPQLYMVILVMLLMLLALRWKYSLKSLFGMAFANALRSKRIHRAHRFGMRRSATNRSSASRRVLTLASGRARSFRFLRPVGLMTLNGFKCRSGARFGGGETTHRRFNFDRRNAPTRLRLSWFLIPRCCRSWRGTRSSAAPRCGAASAGTWGWPAGSRRTRTCAPGSGGRGGPCGCTARRRHTRASPRRTPAARWTSASRPRATSSTAGSRTACCPAGWRSSPRSWTSARSRTASAWPGSASAGTAPPEWRRPHAGSCNLRSTRWNQDRYTQTKRWWSNQ